MVELPPPEPRAARYAGDADTEGIENAIQGDAEGVIQVDAPCSFEADPPVEDDEVAAPENTADLENAIQDVINDIQNGVLDEIVAKRKKVGNTHREIAEQVHQVQEWLTLGKRPNQIRALCAELWGLKTRAAEQRIHDARRQMVLDCNDMDRKDKVGQMLQQLEQVLEQALTMKQGSNAIGAIRLQADLLQLLTRQN